MPEGLKLKIYNELEALLRTKKLDNITIGELARRCGITRQGFYYHFQTTADVFLWRFYQGAEQIAEEGRRAGSIEEPLCLLIRSMKERFWVFKSVSSSAKMRDRLIKKFLDALRGDVRILLAQHFSAGSLGPEDRDLLFDVLSRGIAGYLVRGVDGEDFIPEDVARAIRRLLDTIGARL